MSEARSRTGASVDFVSRQLALFFAAVAVFAAVTTVATGTIHDYEAYVLQWLNILEGGDPWARTYRDEIIPRNAYGPIHILGADLVALHPLLPKLLMSMLTVCAPLLVLAAPIPREKRREALSLMLLLYTCAPLVAISVFFFGINDSLVGFAVLCACVLRSRGRLGWCGCIIGLAALLKFYPLLFAPLLVVSRNGPARLRGILTAALTFALGMAVAWLIWGGAAFQPFQFGDARGPKILSILRFLDQIKDNLPIERPVNFLIDKNALLVLVVATIVPLWGWWTRQGWEVTLLIGSLAIFMTYKVGHPQFYVSWIAVWAWIQATSQDQDARRVARAFTPVVVFLSLFQLVYLVSEPLTGAYLQGHLVWVRIFSSVVMLVCVAVSFVRARPALVRRAGPPPTIRL